MRSARSVGRTVGILLLVQLVGLIVLFALLHPVAGGTLRFLEDAAASATQIRVAVLLLLVNCALTIGISVAGWPTFRQHSEAMALWLLVVSGIMFSLQAVDNAHVLSMLSLSQQHAQAGSQGEILPELAAAVGATRRWAHFTELLAIDLWICSFCSMLLRFALVPRPLAAFGLAMVLLHFSGIPLRGLLGYGIVMPMGMPMALSQIALAAWLMARGFPERHQRPCERAL